MGGDAHCALRHGADVTSKVRRDNGLGDATVVYLVHDWKDEVAAREAEQGRPGYPSARPSTAARPLPTVLGGQAGSQASARPP